MRYEMYGLVRWLCHWLISGFALFLTSHIIPGIKLKGYASAVMAMALIAFLNSVLGPFLQVIAFPVTVLTLGFFALVINGSTLMMASAFMSGFKVSGWWAAILGAIVLALVNTVLHYLLV